jgi:hypothetical protein
MTFQIRSVKTWIALTGAIMLLISQATAQPMQKDAAQRIAELSSRLKNDAANEEQRDKVAGAIRQEVRNFVESSLSPDQSSDVLRQRLKAVLQTQTPDFEFSDPPVVRVAELRNGRSVVVSYSIVRPPHFDLPTIAAFRESNGRFAYAGSIGNDFEGFSLFTHEVIAPTKDVLWLLAGGRAFTFNGSKFQFRLYSFNGNNFETIWAPEPMFDAALQLLPDGFSVSHDDREHNTTVVEQYRTTLSGLIRVR